MPEIQNPNLQTQGPGGSGGGGSDMRSTIVFFGLMLAVLVGYQFLFKPASSPAPQTPSQPAQTQTQAKPARGAAIAQRISPGGGCSHAGRSGCCCCS